MGRYPLMAAVEKYLELRELQVGASTLANEKRTLKHIAGALEDLRERHMISTTHPKTIGPKEVRAFLDWMRDPAAHCGKALDPDTQVRHLARLEGVLEHHGNDVIARMRREGYQFPQKIARKPIHALKQPDVDAVKDATVQMRRATGEPEGWRRAKARFLMAVYVATGLRPSELRLAYLEDLDVKRWRIYVRSPKGAGVWAENRTVTIMPPCRPEVLSYLQAREELLAYYGRTSAVYLIPNLRGGDDRPYSANHFRELKEEVEGISGVDFKLKDLRPTFATLSVEKDPNLLVDVSAQLGHSNLMTTQRYYAQISAESAGARLERAWATDKMPETESKDTATNAVALLLKALGVGNSEELREALLVQVKKAENARIEYSDRLTGYN